MSKRSSTHDGGRQFPQINWLLATNFQYLPEGRWLPIVVQYDLQLAPSAEDSLQWFAELSWLEQELRGGVAVPHAFKDPPQVLQRKPFPFCTLLVDRDFLSRIVADPGWNRTILQAEVGPPLTDDAVRSLSEGPSA